MSTPQQPAVYNSGVGYPVNEVKDGNLTLVDVYGTGQYGILTARQINGSAALGVPLGGPSTAQPTMFSQPDSSIVVLPLATYGLAGDDNTWIAQAFTLAGPGGRVKLLPATYSLQTSLTVPGATPTTPGSHLSGERGTFLSSSAGGSGVTVSAVSSHGSEAGGSTLQGRGAIIERLTIDGTNVPAGTISTGLDVGDQYHLVIQDVVIQNFTASGSTSALNSNPLGAVGLALNNYTTLSEKAHIQRVTINNCTNAFQTFTRSGAITTSRMYSDIDITVNAQPHQNGWVIARQGHVENGKFRMRGNFSHDSNPANCAVIQLGVGSASPQQGHIFDEEMDIFVEADPGGSGTSMPTTIQFGLNADNTISTARGRLNFADPTWQAAGNYTPSAKAAAQFQFSGRILGDSTLSTAGLPYSALTSGTTYTNNGIDAIACVSGGTVTSILINGVTTGLTSGAFPWPMNATLQINFTGGTVVAYIGALTS